MWTARLAKIGISLCEASDDYRKRKGGRLHSVRSWCCHRFINVFVNWLLNLTRRHQPRSQASRDGTCVGVLLWKNLVAKFSKWRQKTVWSHQTACPKPESARACRIVSTLTMQLPRRRRADGVSLHKRNFVDRLFLESIEGNHQDPILTTRERRTHKRPWLLSTVSIA